MSYHPFGINSDNTTNGPLGKCYDKNIRNDLCLCMSQFNDATASNLSFINNYHGSSNHEII